MILGWEVNIRSIRDDESVKTCVGSRINCFRPNWDVIASILEPSYVVVSCLYRLDDLVLKSPRVTIKYEFLLVILSKLSSKLSANFSETSSDCLGEQHKEIKLHNLRPNYISKFMQSSKYQISNNLKARGSL